MLIGLGDLGFHILQFLARVPNVGKIVVADINEYSGLVKTRDAIFGAAHQGFYPEIRFMPMDMSDIDETVEILTEERPNVICNATSLMSWWVRHTLPGETFRRLEEAGSGPWIPMHLTLTNYLMQAVQRSGIETHVVNCSFPDGVNPILGKVGLAPTVGGGNIALLVPPVQMVVAEKLKVPMRSVRVFLIGHHSVVTTGMRAPFWVKIIVDDEDVTELFPHGELRSLVVKSRSRGMSQAGWSGPPPQQATASCFLQNILAIYFDTGELLHVSGPKGLPGGYPVHLSSAGVEVFIPKELTLADAIKINEEGAKFDGIERIKKDGTLVLTEQSSRIMREVLGYECEEFSIEESAVRAKELVSLIKKRK